MNATQRVNIAGSALMQALKMFHAALLYVEREELNPLEGLEMLAKASGAFGVTIKALGRAAPEITALAIAGDVLQELAVFLRVNHPAFVSEFEAVLKEFSEIIAKKYGA